MYYAMSFYVCVCVCVAQAAGRIYTEAGVSDYIIQTHSSHSLSTV